MALLKREIWSRRLFKKVTASILSVVFMLNLVSPVFECGEVSASDSFNWRGIYETPAELVDGTYNTSDSGTAGYINFGTRPDVKYQISGKKEASVPAGAIKWLITGKDTDGNIVLYSEEPLMSAKCYDADSNSIFHDSSNVYSSSNFRSQLQRIQESSDYFSGAEQGIMLYTTVNTDGSDSTTDKLYGLHSDDYGSSDKNIYAGADNSLPVNIKYWKSYHWLRSTANFFNEVIGVDALYRLYRYKPNNDMYTVAAACKLNLSPILFAAHSAISTTAFSGDSFQTLSSSAPEFNLRLKGGSMGGAVSNAGEGKITYKANSDERLVVLAQSTGEGTTYQYVKDGTGNSETLDLSKLGDLAEGTYSVKAWTEKKSSVGNAPMYYASTPIEFTFKYLKSYVAKIGDTYYNTLQDAFNACTGDSPTTITLLENVQLGPEEYLRAEHPTILNVRGATLDLNGFSISKDPSSQDAIFQLSYYGWTKFVLTDSSEAGTGTVSGNTLFANTDGVGPDMTIEGGIISCDVLNKHRGVVVYISGGVITKGNMGYIYVDEYTHEYIHGGIFYSKDEFEPYLADGCTLEKITTGKYAGYYEVKEQKDVTLKFNANRPSGSTGSGDDLSDRVVQFNGTFGSQDNPLPSLTTSGYSFAGWYTHASGGTKVDIDSSVQTVMGTYSETLTLYAHWTQKSTPQAEHFTLETETVTYDGSSHAVTVSVKSGINGMGSISNVYYNNTTTPPTNAGTYSVSIDVAEGGSYASAAKLSLGSFTIEKANPNYTVPNGREATYGQILSDVILPNGWKWNDATQSVGNAGTNNFDATFTPSDTTNYNTVIESVAITVNKATPSIPSSLTAIYGQKLGDVKFEQPDIGTWTWQNANTTLNTIGNQRFLAKFESASGNHLDVDNVGVDVYVNRKSINSEDITVQGVADLYEYDGNSSSIQPTVKVLDGETELVKNTDYEVNYRASEWSDETKLAIGSVTITGLGNYDGNRELTFNIKDKVVPSGKVIVENDSSMTFSLFSTDISYQYMFNSAKNITIEAMDSESGIKDIYYHIAEGNLCPTKSNGEAYTDSEIEQAIGNDGASGWQKYSRQITLGKGTKNVAYVKILDNNDNAKYINTQGIIVYNGVDLKSSSEYTKTTNNNIIISNNLNNNSVKEVYNGDTRLERNVDYEIVDTDAGQAIEIKGTYLDTLVPSDGGHTFKVSFNPMGEEFNENFVKGNKPSEIITKIYVKRADLTANNFIFTGPENLAYDGNGKEASVVYNDQCTGGGQEE